MNKIFIFLLLICARNTSFLFAQQEEYWIPIITTTIYQPITEMNFLNNNCGIILTQYDQIKTTSNSGSSWVSSNINASYIANLNFAPNSDTGYCYFGYMSSIFYRTSDKGLTWSVCSNQGNFGAVNSIKFTDGQTGFLGSYANLYRSTNAGVNWSIVSYFPTTSAAQIVDIFFVNKQKGFLVSHPTGSTQAVLHMTTDSGSTWDTLYQTNSINISRIYFTSEQIGYLIDQYRILRTSDGGQNWEVSYDGEGVIYSININNQGIGYAVGYKNNGDTSHLFMIKTVNNGVDWSQRIPNNVISNWGISQVQIFSNVAYISTGTAIYKLDNLTQESNIKTEVLENFSLSQNYPNPFNPNTTINFQLPVDTRIRLNVYDITGKEVRSLINDEQKTAGYYSINFNGNTLSSGIYYYRITAGNYVESKKMMLIK